MLRDRALQSDLVPGWEGGTGPLSPAEFVSWLQVCVTSFQRFPEQDGYWLVNRTVKLRDATIVSREPNPGFVATRLGVAKQNIRNAYRWFAHHQIEGPATWPNKLDTSEEIERELMLLLARARKLPIDEPEK